MTPHIEKSLVEIESKIETLAEAYLSSGKPYLLSRLGLDLGEELKVPKAQSGQSLAQYLIERMSDRYTVVLTGPFNNIQALVRNVDANEPVKSAESTNDGKSIPKYSYRFWAAFSVPLKGRRRFINMDSFIFEDEDEKPSGNYVEIEADFIPSEDMEDRAKKIAQNINEWLKKNQFSAERFTAKSRLQNEKLHHHVGHRTILDVLIESLDRRQLANTSLSLDVVADLLRKRV